MSRSPLPREFTIKTSTILSIALVVGVVALILKIWDIVLVVLTAVVLSSFVDGAVLAFKKIRIPRVPAVILVYLLLFAVFGGVLYLIVPAFIGEISGIVNLLPLDSPIRDAILLFSDFANAKAALGAESSLALLGTAREVFASLSGGLLQSLSGAFGGLINLLLIVIVSLYLSMQENGVEQFLKAVTPVTSEAYVISLWRRTKRKIGQWFKGQLLSALLLSVLTYIGLLFLSVPYALVLSLVVLVFGLIPFGIIVATVPALIIAFLNGGAEMALFVALLYIILQRIEENIFQPIILKKVTGVPSLIILLSIVIGAKLAGFLGVFLGLPVAIMLTEMVNDYETEKRASMSAAEKRKLAKVEKEVPQ